MEPDIKKDKDGNITKRPANFCSNFGIVKKKARNIIKYRRRTLSSSEIPDWMMYETFIENNQTVVKQRCVWQKGNMVLIGE